MDKPFFNSAPAREEIMPTKFISSLRRQSLYSGGSVWWGVALIVLGALPGALVLAAVAVNLAIAWLIVRVLLDGADNCLVVKTLAVKPGLRPAKLPDIRAFFATVSLHTSALHPILLRRRCGVEESSGIEPYGGVGEAGISRVNCPAAAMFPLESYLL
jgi:hypothetical protein